MCVFPEMGAIWQVRSTMKWLNELIIVGWVNNYSTNFVNGSELIVGGSGRELLYLMLFRCTSVQARSNRRAFFSKNPKV